MKKLFHYLNIWWLMSKNSFVVVLYSKLSLFIFLAGKIFRFTFFLLFLFFLIKGTRSLAGYNFQEVAFFFLIFNLIDIGAQFLFRETYRFRSLVVSGDFDLVLVKPMSALFRSLMGGADVIDLITIPPLIVAICYIGHGLNPSLLNTAYGILLILNAFLISAALHIIILGIGIITLEVDNLMMIYRDFTSLGKLPVDIYRQPVRFAITYLIPIGVMVTFPAKALLGLVSFWGVVSSLVLSLVLIFLAIRFWNYALTRYTSASS